MIKKIMFAGVVSCLVASSVHATIEKPEGWYAKGSWENMFSNKKYHNLSAGGLSLGYKKDFLRAEIQASYARVTEKVCGIGGCDWFRKGHNFNFGAHGFLDWDNATMFSPYVGLGLEKATYKGVFGGYGSSHSNRVHAVGLVGTRAYLTSNVALDAGYKVNINNLHNGGAGSLGLAWHFD